MMQTPLKPPFTRETALLKVKAAEDAWNSCEPERVALAYTPDSQWRNRTEFLTGREAIKAFLRRKWAKELDYHLVKELRRTTARERKQKHSRHSRPLGTEQAVKMSQGE